MKLLAYLVMKISQINAILDITFSICDIKLEVICSRYVLDINGTLFFIFLFKLRTQFHLGNLLSPLIVITINDSIPACTAIPVK